MNFDAEHGKQYERISTNTITGYELIFQLAKFFLEQSLPDDAEILVIGAGGGKELVTFGSGNPNWKFTGVDPAGQMVAFAQYKAEQAGMGERVRLIQGTAGDVPADLRFDAATCILVFPFVHGDEAKLATLREIEARLKPGAPLVMVAVTEEVLREDFRAVWRANQAANGFTPEEIAKFGQDVRASVQPIAAARLLELLSEAGFVDAVPFFRGLWFSGWFVWKQKD